MSRTRVQRALTPVILALSMMIWLGMTGTASAKSGQAPADPGAPGAEKAAAAQAATKPADKPAAQKAADKPAAQKAADKPAAQKAADKKSDEPATKSAPTATQGDETQSGPRDDRFDGRFGDPTEPQPLSNADKNDAGANGQCPEGPYCSTRDGSPSENGKGDGKATGKPSAGEVGNADNKNPKGQFPNGSDNNAGYECDRNQGVGQGNPAHTGCEGQVEEPDCVPTETQDADCNEIDDTCVPTPSQNADCEEIPGCVPAPGENADCEVITDGGGDCVPSPANDFCGEGEGDCVPTPANDFCDTVVDNPVNPPNPDNPNNPGPGDEVIGGGGVLPPVDVIDDDGDTFPTQVAGPVSGGAVSAPTVAPADAGTDTLPNTGMAGGLEALLLLGLSMLGAGALLLRRRVVIG